jgi:hypothetical protein
VWDCYSQLWPIWKDLTSKLWEKKPWDEWEQEKNPKLLDKTWCELPEYYIGYVTDKLDDFQYLKDEYLHIIFSNCVYWYIPKMSLWRGHKSCTMWPVARKGEGWIQQKSKKAQDCYQASSNNINIRLPGRSYQWLTAYVPVGPSLFGDRLHLHMIMPLFVAVCRVIILTRLRPNKMMLGR